MSTDVFSMECDALEGARLAGFKGVERLSQPFEVDLFFTVPSGTDVKGAVGGRATLVADRDDGRGPMRWHGVLAAIRLLHETAERALYRASLVPKLWLLSHHVRSYVHTRKKVDVLAADTLKDGGFSTADYAFHTDAGAYPQEEFVCQYRESHLDFVHRWFEREGLYYYFEHADGGAEKMVIVDDKAHHHPLFGKGSVRYVPSAGADTSAGECLRELHADFRLLPASVLLSDYNYANPSAPVTGEKAVSGTGQGKIREYGYRVFTEGEAGRLAGVKAQSIGCRELVVTAVGDALGLRAGYSFEVEDAPADLPAKYLAIEVRHAGAVAGSSSLVKRYTGLDQAETYRVEVVAIPSNVQYRAPQSTAWPRIYGFENGSVDGPAESQYAQIDEQGRYLVRFKFDVSDLPDGSTSTYLRMMQPHGGSTEGWHFPLRKGTEVMVSFQGGDPDRPVIAGVVPNALTPSNVTSKNHTQNVLRTGGNNYMVMDDQEGAQFIDMATPEDDTNVHMGKPIMVAFSGYGDQKATEVQISFKARTDGNAGFWIGGGWWEEVNQNKNVYVRGPVTIGYQQTHKLEIGGKSEEFYNGGLMQKITAGFEQNITGDGTQDVRASWVQNVSALNYGHYGEWMIDVDSSWLTAAGGNVVIKSTKGHIMIHAEAGDVTVKSPNKIELDSPTVTIRGSEVETSSAFQFDFWATKNEVGIEAFVALALDGAVKQLSGETIGTKLSNTGVEMSRIATASKSYGIKEETQGISFRKAALSALTAGLVKIG